MTAACTTSPVLARSHTATSALLTSRSTKWTSHDRSKRPNCTCRGPSRHASATTIAGTAVQPSSPTPDTDA